MSTTARNILVSLRLLRQRGVVSVCFARQTDASVYVCARFVGEVGLSATEVQFREGIDHASASRRAHRSQVDALVSAHGLDHVRVYVRAGADLSDESARWLATLIRRADRLAQRRAAHG